MDDESDIGFSFGSPNPKDDGKARAPKSDDFDLDFDAVEVSGEPVTRNEASRLGLSGMVAPKRGEPARTRRSTRFQMKYRNVGLDAETNEQMNRAWDCLMRNEIEEALTLGQELVFKFPNLMAAKLLIARCFVNRKEFDKALAILQAIPDADKDAEVHYYVGLCQSRLGRMKEALDAMKRSRDSTTEMYIRKRASDFILHLQGEQVVCPMCEKKVLYDSMVEVGDRTVCANCADLIAQEQAEDGDDEEGGGPARRRRRLRPPRSKVDMLLKFLAFIIILLLAGYVLYMVAPDTYNELRGYLPAEWVFPPHAGRPGGRPANEFGQPQGGQSSEPRQIPTMLINSPPLARGLVGVGMSQQVYIDGMRNIEGEYSAKFDPNPAGPFAMNSKTGVFSWTPAPADAGREFTLTFGALFKGQNIRSMDQVNKIKVSTGLVVDRVGEWSTPSASTLHLIADDLNGDGAPELMLVSGDYWQGQISVLDPTGKGRFPEIARASISGRPVGAGLVIADKERWLAVADHWNSRLRFFGMREGVLSEMAVTVDLPGRPILAVFDQASSLSVVLCRTQDGLRANAYRQVNQLESRQIGSWVVPEEFVWRAMYVLESVAGQNPSLRIALVSGDSANSLLILSGENSVQWSGVKEFDGVLVDSFYDKAGKRLLFLAEGEGGFEISVDAFTAAGRVGEPQRVKLGATPILGGAAILDLTGDGTGDLLAIASGKAAVFPGDPVFKDSGPFLVALSTPSRLFGKAVVLPGPNGAGDKAFFVDRTGVLWRIGLAE